MHIPDGVLSNEVALVTSVLGASALGFSLWKLKGAERDRTMVQTGMTAAFVFAAQMVNFRLYPFPISGHLLGGVLAATMVGPWAGALVIAAVLVVQCLLFGDGGITALGANMINMGLIGSVVGYTIYAAVRGAIGGRKGVLIGAMAASWFSVILAAGAFSLEFAASGHLSAFKNVLGWMILVHAAIGVGEALITGCVLRFVLLARPDLLEAEPAAGAPGTSPRTRYIQTAFAGLAVSLAVALFLAPLASQQKDGLEWVGEEKLGITPASSSIVKAPFPDYQFPYLAHASALAGVVGTLAVFGLGLGLARVFAVKQSGGEMVENAAGYVS